MSDQSIGQINWAILIAIGVALAVLLVGDLLVSSSLLGVILSPTGTPSTNIQTTAIPPIQAGTTAALPTGISTPSVQTSPDAPSQSGTQAPFTQLVVLPTQPPLDHALPSPTPTRMPRVTRLQIPVIRVDARVVEMGWQFQLVDGLDQVVWDDPAHAVGHIMNSANPGEGSNIVFSGHNNIEGAVFADLWKLKTGDGIILTAGDADRKYLVASVRIEGEKYASAAKRAENARAMDPTPSEQVTLISCYPPTNNTFRVIVVAFPDR